MRIFSGKGFRTVCKFWVIFGKNIALHKTPHFDNPQNSMLKCNKALIVGGHKTPKMLGSPKYSVWGQAIMYNAVDVQSGGQLHGMVE